MRTMLEQLGALGGPFTLIFIALTGCAVEQYGGETADMAGVDEDHCLEHPDDCGDPHTSPDDTDTDGTGNGTNTDDTDDGGGTNNGTDDTDDGGTTGTDPDTVDCSVDFMEVYSAGYTDENNTTASFTLANGVRLATPYGFYASLECSPLDIEQGELPGTMMLCIKGRDGNGTPSDGVLDVNTPAEFTNIEVITCDHDLSALVEVNGSNLVKQVPGAGENECSNSSTDLSWSDPSNEATFTAPQNEPQHPEAIAIVDLVISGQGCE